MWLLFAILVGMENTFEHTSAPQERLESQSENVVIEFGPEGQAQKFVALLGDGNDEAYVASYLADAYHMNMVVHAAKELGSRGVKAYSAGGGFMTREGDTVRLYGQSTQTGRFNEEKTLKAMQEAYPNLKIVVE